MTALAAACSPATRYVPTGESPTADAVSQPYSTAAAVGDQTAEPEQVTTSSPATPTPVPALLVTPPTSPTTVTSSAPGRVLWEGDTRRGIATFENVERTPGTVDVVNDPTGRYGPTFRMTTWDATDKERCETRGMRSPTGAAVRIDGRSVGQTLYLGWRAMWGPLPTSPGKWVALFQLHLSGVGLTGPGPVVIRTLGDGDLRLQLIAPGLFDRDVWRTPLRVGSWNTFVLAVHVSTSATEGWVQLWYNGQPQKFANGSTRYAVPTLIGDHVNPKWGVYRSVPVGQTATAYLQRPRLGTSYAAVAPLA